MIHGQELIDAFEALRPEAWQGNVYRYMFAANPPPLENTRGARWNLAGVPAIYASLSRDTVLAEAEYQISLQPRRPTARRTLYTLRVALGAVIDLRPPAALASVGLSHAALADTDWGRCQHIGGAAEGLKNDGLLVSSASSDGANIVIFANNHDGDLEITDSEIIS